MPPCRSGLDRLFDPDILSRYRGLRVAVIANPASVDSHFIHAVDRFAACPDWRFTAAFGPQHGARADLQDNMIESPDDVDARLGIPVYSLYSLHRKPTADMLRDVDVLFCDLFDIGTRAYTFLWTAILAMQPCAEQGRRFVVLDRPNPIGGELLEGPVLDPAFATFVGLYPIPMRHAMTMGELASYLNTEFNIGAHLEVIEVEGWHRAQWFDQTGLPWVMPSPNMPTLATATVYPGAVLAEATNLSEGRGTTRPFEFIGAPFLNGDQLAEYLNGLQYPGVHFRPAWFRPAFDKWCGQLCGGVQLHVTDRDRFRPFRAGIAVLYAAMELAPHQFAWRQPPFEYEDEKLPIDILNGTDRIRLNFDSAIPLEFTELEWLPALERFRDVRRPYLRYP